MISKRLTASDFGVFFDALWREPGTDSPYEPFPWQLRLLDRVAGEGWPHTLDLPTASGKTAVLEIAVFALALDALRPAAERRAPRRIVFVIDRRVVVDHAFRRASRICARLAQADHEILQSVATNLRIIQGDADAPPLMAAQLRGGMPHESEWARTPTQPLILVSTVDQVGSRLLFRGYGVSRSMRPVHAGLLGEDVLFLLDEVHLSRPFEETLADVKGYAAPPAETVSDVPHRFEVVRMSATPGNRSRDVISFDESDKNHPILARRVRASKRAYLRMVDARSGEKGRAKVAAACIEEARELFGRGGVEVVAVIVNRVDTARKAAALASAEAGALGWSVRLMTGRMRPLDRDDLLREVEPLVMAGRRRGTGQRLLFVSTQAIEAGADFDFDALITECASLDALRQRFGRLDRFGELRETRAAILAASGDVDGDETPDDPVYGIALARTWQWLSERALTDEAGQWIDLGIVALEEPLKAAGNEVFASPVCAPVLLPVYIDLYAQTSPEPQVCPDVSMFLHGPERGPADVQIVWRGDIEPTWLEKALGPEGEKWTAFLRDVVNVCPPSSLEVLQVPLTAVRTWLARVAAPGDKSRAGLSSVSDMEGVSEEEAEYAPLAPILIWQGDDTEVSANPARIWPGATVIVPTSYGGIREGNWDPEGEDVEVADRGDEAQLLHRGRPVIRWARGAMSWNRAGLYPTVDEEELMDGGAPLERRVFASWSRTILDANPAGWAQEALSAMLRGPSRVVRMKRPDAEDELTGEDRSDGEERFVRTSVAARKVAPQTLHKLRLRLPGPENDALEAATEDDNGSFTGAETPLVEHLEAVSRAAKQFAEALGLGSARVADLELAGRLHDIGKADPRFQLMLHGGDPVRASVAATLLAKSSTPSSDRGARARAQRAAGYPERTRHELTSVALTQLLSEMPNTADPDLVLHLIASHHGYCRPLAPIVVDADPVEVRFEHDGAALKCSSAHGLARLDSGLAERFSRLVRRYGWWRLAWMEAMLRLADHRASEQAEKRTE
jgi:CRISPR-associated endonuclease/helicase Cas3